jgi:hypothetical protein
MDYEKKYLDSYPLPPITLSRSTQEKDIYVC